MMRDAFPVRTLREEVTLYIKDKIINGNMKPGDKSNEIEAGCGTEYQQRTDSGGFETDRTGRICNLQAE